MISDHGYKRVCWASRRGMLELDLILTPFVERRFLELHNDDQQRYIKLLEEEDNDLFSWFLGRQLPDDPDLSSIVVQILSFSKSD